MRRVLTSCLLLLCMGAMAQTTLTAAPKPKKHHTGNYILTGSLMFLAGASDGVNQALQFQYPGFKSAFPGANDQFWKPSLSGANKYKNGDPNQGARFPGSCTWLVFTTDGYHLTRFADHFFMSGAVACKLGRFEKKRWYVYVIEAAGYWLVNRAGFCITYNHFRSRR